MRAALLAAGLLLAGSCGGSPIAPGPAPPSPGLSTFTLESGTYTLVMTLSTSGRPSCETGFCSSISLCVGHPSPTAASFNVSVERSGDAAIVRAQGGISSLVLMLTVTPGAVAGTISGAARDAQGVAMEATGTITGGPPSDPAYALSGNVDGQVSFAGVGCSNNGHSWSLARR